MTLPPRITKPKKEKRWRSQAHLNFVRSHHCSKCGAAAPIEAAHVRLGGHGGMGFKPPDWHCVSLCGPCHRLQHEQGEKTFWEGADIEGLIDAFCHASPKHREIRTERYGRD